MAVVARVGAPFDLKSTALSGLALVLRQADLGSLAGAMAERFGSSPGVFSHEPVVIELSFLGDDPAVEVDFVGLVGLLRSHRLLAAGVRGGTERLHQAALEAGLGDVADDPTAAVPPRTELLADRSGAWPGSTAGGPSPESLSQPAASTAPGASAADTKTAVEPPGPVAALTAPTLIVDKPLRSGQQVYAKGGDLVVLATVNVGAEVIADGSIHVYGPLRGKAVAGAKGNVEARIFSTCMEPQLLAIAGTYRTTENPLPNDVVGRPAQIRLEGERLVFEPLA